MEYGKDNIRVNTVCPSSINGQRIKNVIKKEAEYRNSTPEKIKSTYLNQTSLKKFIDAEDNWNDCLLIVTFSKKDFRTKC